tara:strand:+ start:569 stop:1312 length:744 start_codon:yes stop_codon:yes gene_type:complete
MEESTFFDSFKVQASETDASKSIKVPNLLGYMQEAAWTNATKLGFSTYDMLKEGITWVVNRMYIEFLVLPTYPQVLKIETWPSDLDKYFAYRDFRVFDESHNLMVQATSNWLVLDIKTRKLIPIPDHIKDARFSVDRGGMDKIKGKCTFDQSKIENEFPIGVSWFDLDVNNHVNNTKYFQWILDSLDQSVLANKKPKSIDITFKAEAGYRDEIVSQSYALDDNTFAHQITNKSTGKVLVVAKSKFSD